MLQPVRGSAAEALRSRLPVFGSGVHEVSIKLPRTVVFRVLTEILRNARRTFRYRFLINITGIENGF